MTTPLIKHPIKISDKPIKIHSFGADYEIDLYVTSYVNPPGLAVVATMAGNSADVFGKVSASIPESALLADFGFFVKDYGENEEWVPGLFETGLFTKIDIQARSGMVYLKAWQLNPDVISHIQKTLAARG